MKKPGLTFILTFLLIPWYVISQDNAPIRKGIELQINYSPELQSISHQWLTAYTESHPDINLKLMNIHDGGAEPRDNINEIDIVSEQYFRDFIDKEDAWHILVGRKILVPIIHSSNPLLIGIESTGINKDALAKMFSKQTTEIDHHQSNAYILDDDDAIKSLIDYLGMNEADLTAKRIGSPSELALTASKDKNSVSFCWFSDVMADKNKGSFENLRILPLDFNTNGILDDSENIYSGFDAFRRGVYLGKYPKTLINNIYITSTEQATPSAVEFVEWVLSDGQTILGDNGFNDLIIMEKQSGMARLNPIINTNHLAEKNDNAYLYLLSVLVAVIALAIYLYTLQHKASKKKHATDSIDPNKRSISIHSLKLPKGLYYEKSHTWAFMDISGNVKVGLDDFLQHVTGKITRFEFKKPGDRIKKNETLATVIQDGKQLQLYAPVSGSIKCVNEELITHPELANTSPYEKGWLYILEPSNWIRETNFLSMADVFRDWLTVELIRLKDFLSSNPEVKGKVLSPTALQDGGAIADHVLQDLGPRVWEDFQKNFIDNSGLQ
jgi:glycine cleavage system H lipoate-binding protein